MQEIICNTNNEIPIGGNNSIKERAVTIHSYYIQFQIIQQALVDSNTTALQEFAHHL